MSVEVMVTDDDGRPVTGLPREAFRLRVDGDEVPIDYFSEIGAPRRPAEWAAGADEAPESEPPPVNYLVFIDDHVALARDRDFVLARLRRDLELMGPRDRMAVVAYDGSQLAVLAEWTADREKLERALAAAGERPADGIKWIALRRMPSYIANWEGNAIRRTTLSIASALRALPVPEGRKVLLLAAGSLDPAEAARAGRFALWCPVEPCVGTAVLGVLVDTANLLDYSIYAIDVEGREVDGDWGRETRLHAMLGMLADATGGRVLRNKNRTQALATAAADARTYYSLGFVPTGPADDLRHRVEVELVQPGLEVRHQLFFSEIEPSHDWDLEVLNALLLDEHPEYPPLELAARATRSDWPGMELSFTVEVPIGRLVWSERNGQLQARAEVRYAVQDGLGESTDVERRLIVVERLEAPAVTAREARTYELPLRRRRHRLSVLVRDLGGDSAWLGLAEVPRPRRAPATAGK